MKYLLLLSCIILCTCSSKKEEDAVLEKAPSILECPPEDIASYPPTPELPDKPGTTLDGGCSAEIPVSQKEVLLDAQGGVRCVTTLGTKFGIGYGANNGPTEEEWSYNCTSGGNEGGDNYPHLKYTNLKCSWLTSTKIDDIVHIRVDKNETGKERKIVIYINSGYCYGYFSVIQAAE